MTEIKAEGLDEARWALADSENGSDDRAFLVNTRHLRHAIAVADQLAAEVARLTAALAEAREVGPRWERKDYDTGPSLWRLRVGDTFLNGSGILTADGLLPITTDDGQSFSTLHEAARAVCERLGLPLITEGLPKENADV